MGMMNRSCRDASLEGSTRTLPPSLFSPSASFSSALGHEEITLTAVRGLAAVVVSHPVCLTERASNLAAEINIEDGKEVFNKMPYQRIWHNISQIDCSL